MQLTNIVEHKDANDNQLQINEINSGIYLFKSNILIDKLSKLTNINMQNEYYLTQIFDFISDDKTIVKKINNSNEVLGINTSNELTQIKDAVINEK